MENATQDPNDYDCYTFRKEIGKGAFGTVSVFEHNGNEVAVKEIPQSKMSKQKRLRIAKEFLAWLAMLRAIISLAALASHSS